MLNPSIPPRSNIVFRAEVLRINQVAAYPAPIRLPLHAWSDGVKSLKKLLRATEEEMKFETNDSASLVTFYRRLRFKVTRVLRVIFGLDGGLNKGVKYTKKNDEDDERDNGADEGENYNESGDDDLEEANEGVSSEDHDYEVFEEEEEYGDEDDDDENTDDEDMQGAKAQRKSALLGGKILWSHPPRRHHHD